MKTSQVKKGNPKQRSRAGAREAEKERLKEKFGEESFQYQFFITGGHPQMSENDPVAKEWWEYDSPWDEN